MNKFLKLLISWLAIVNFHIAVAQNVNMDKKDYSDFPYWIKMTDDPKVNYLEAVNAYNEYWKDKEKPLMEQELLDKKEDDAKGLRKKLSRKEKKKQIEAAQMAYDCKRFERWKAKVFPYVQEDGRILTPEERLEIWRKQNEK